MARLIWSKILSEASATPTRGRCPGSRGARCPSATCADCCRDAANRHDASLQFAVPGRERTPSARLGKPPARIAEVRALLDKSASTQGSVDQSIGQLACAIAAVGPSVCRGRSRGVYLAHDQHLRFAGVLHDGSYPVLYLLALGCRGIGVGPCLSRLPDPVVGAPASAGRRSLGPQISGPLHFARSLAEGATRLTNRRHASRPARGGTVGLQFVRRFSRDRGGAGRSLFSRR